MLDQLPIEVIQNIINFIPLNQLNNISKINRKFRFFSNKRLYRHITYLNDYQQDNVTVINSKNIDNFLANLSSYNVQFIQKMSIFHDDCNLYNQLLKYKINFIIEVFSSTFTNYYHFLQNLMLKQAKVENYLIVDGSDLSLGYNGHENDELEMTINNNNKLYYTNLKLHLNSRYSATFSFANLNLLLLSTTMSSMFFIDNNWNTITPLNLKSLSLTYHHSFAREKLSKLNLQWSNLKNLELKISCITNCNCLVEFIQDLPPLNLDKFFLINYKFNQDSKNLYQFKLILSLLSKFNSDLMYLNINNFGNNSFDWKILQNLNCQTLIIPDFFNNYNFSFNFNCCQCFDCNQTRILFNYFAKIDSENNFNHKFEKKLLVTGNDNKIINNEINLKFFKYLVNQAQNQYSLFNQAMFGIGTGCDWDQYPIKQDPDLFKWAQLLAHNLQTMKGKKLVLGGFSLD